MRIGDAVQCGSDRLKENKLFLYTQKTGVPVQCVLPDFVVRDIEAAPKNSKRFYFWSGESKLHTAVGVWQQSLQTLFSLAGVSGGHAHRFRDTFAVELLLAGVPLERVSVLLGHQSIRVTERHYAPWTRSRQEQLIADLQRALMPGDWIGQTAANAAMGQYIIALAKLAGVKTLNVVRREEAAEQVRQWGGDRVVLQGGNLHKDIEEALDGRKLSLVLDTVGGAPVGELAKSLKPGGSVVVYGLQSGQFPAMPPKEFIYRGLSLHGFWLINWIRNAPRTEIEEIYQKLGDLVADGSLSAAVEHVYPLDQFKEAFRQSLKSNRSGKILFKF